MQKKLIVAAVAGALAAPLAFAQSNVTIYGVGDVYVESIKSGDNKAFRVEEGGLSGSRIGFRVTEDLGGGLSANVVFEGAVVADNPGAFSFARQAYAGLAGKAWGSVNLGRQYTPMFTVAAKTDATGYADHSPFVMLGSLGSVGPNTGNLIRQSNAVRYDSPSFGGFSLAGMYGAGERATDPRDANDMYSLAGQYGAGPLYVGAAWSRTQDVGAVSGADFDSWLVGATFQFGPAKLFANYVDGEQEVPGASSNDQQTWQLGAHFKVGPAGTIVGSYVDHEADGRGDAKGYFLSYQHALSKRTTAYATYATLRNDDNASYTLNGFANSAAGDDPRALIFGMRHVF